MSRNINQMKISELIELAEAQARKEEENPPVLDADHDASWAATLAMLRIMKERGVPEALRDRDEKVQ